MSAQNPPPRPTMLGAVDDDVHGREVVRILLRHARRRMLRPVVVHVSGFTLAGAVFGRMGSPFEEPFVPMLNARQAEDAFAAWRGAQPLLARAAVPPGTEIVIAGGAPPAIEIRELVVRLEASLVVVGRSHHVTCRRGLLSGSTAFGLARELATDLLVVDGSTSEPSEEPEVCDGPAAGERSWMSSFLRPPAPLDLLADHRGPLLLRHAEGADRTGDGHPAALPTGSHDRRPRERGAP
jgi:nucleotide-binding universal stress UspA family protein